MMENFLYCPPVSLTCWEVAAAAVVFDCPHVAELRNNSSVMALTAKHKINRMALSGGALKT